MNQDKLYNYNYINKSFLVDHDYDMTMAMMTMRMTETKTTTRMMKI